MYKLHWVVIILFDFYLIALHLITFNIPDYMLLT